mgnify:CR=1 FL=1
MNSKTKPINELSEFFQEPTSQNFIKIFDYIKSNKNIKWKIYEKEVNKVLKNTQFNHQNYETFLNHLWEQLSYFDFESLICNSIIYESEEEGLSKTDNELIHTAGQKESYKEIKKMTSSLIAEEEEITGGEIKFNNGLASKPFTFFQLINRIKKGIPDSDLLSKHLDKLNNKAEDISTLLLRLFVEDKNNSIKHYDLAADYHEDRVDFPTESLEIISPFMFKFIYQGIEKEDKPIDRLEGFELIVNFIFLKLILGQYHHKTLCQKYLNKIFEKVKFKKDLLKFNNTYSNLFLNKSIEKTFLEILKKSSYSLHKVSQAALTIFVRESLRIYYNSDSGKELSLHNRFLVHCVAMSGFFINNFSHGKKNESLSTKLSPVKEIPEFEKLAFNFSLSVFYLLTSTIDREELDPNEKPQKDLKFNKSIYIAPSISIDILEKQYPSIDEYFEELEVEKEDFRALNLNLMIKYLIKNANDNNKNYTLNPFSKPNGRIDVDLLQWPIFSPDEPDFDLNLFSSNIYALPLFLEGYENYFKYSEDQFDNYLQITNIDFFKQYGLESYNPLCFVLHFIYLLLQIQDLKNIKKPMVNIRFNIKNFKDNFSLLSSDKSFTSELYLFNDFLNSQLCSPEIINESFGVLERQCLILIKEQSEAGKKPKSSHNLAFLDRDKLEWIKSINPTTHEEMFKVREEIISALNKDHATEDIGWGGKLRIITENLMPDTLRNLIKFINHNRPTIRDKFFSDNKRLTTYGVASYSYLIHTINKMEEEVYQRFKSLISDKNQISFLEGIRQLDVRLTNDFMRQTKMLNDASHRNGSLRPTEANAVFEFLSREDLFGQIIKI